MAEPGFGTPDFLGPPGHLHLVAPELQSQVPGQRVQGVHWGQSTPVGVPAPRLRGGGRDPSRLRLRLDPATPAGEYVAVLDLADGQQREVNVQVQAHARLRTVPGTLRFVGEPGAEVSAQLMLENLGNVDIPLGEALVTGVFDDLGIEAALASTYRLESDDLNQIVGHIFSRLRDAHGGLLKLRVEGGAQALAPGERRLLVLFTTLGPKLKAGHRYHGVLGIAEHNVALRIEVAGPAPGTSKGTS